MFNQFQKRASERDESIKRVAAKMGGAGGKEGFCFPVGKTHHTVGIDHDHRMLDGIEHHACCFGIDG